MENKDSTQIQLIDASNVKDIKFPSSYDGIYAEKFLTGIFQNSPGYYFTNVQHTECFGLMIDREIVIPCTINKLPLVASSYKPSETCYVVSPFSQVIINQIDFNGLGFR
jgi:hypothetical protein